MEEVPIMDPPPPLDENPDEEASNLQDDAEDTNPTSFTPPKPTMGGLTRYSADHYAPWTGGIPKADWSGLEDGTVESYSSPNQIRPTSISTSSKQYHYRKMGLTTKFKRGDDIEIFQLKVEEHLKDFGMDTITYMPDPLDASKVVSCTENHTRLEPSVAKSAMETQITKYDQYDRENDKTAKLFLMNSLDDKFAKTVRTRVSESDPFPVLYLTVMRVAKAISLARYERLKDTLRSIKAKNFPGSNIEELTTQFVETADELSAAGQYDHNLNLTLVDACLGAGGPETYRYELNGIRSKLDKILFRSQHLSAKDVERALASEDLGYKDICMQVTDEYRKHFEDGLWGPASKVIDRGAPKPSASLASVTTIDQLKALLLTGGSDSRPPRDKSNDTCKKCGKKGHWQRECPQNRGGGGSGRDNSNQRRSNKKPGGSGGYKGSLTGKNAWKTQPPRPGGPEAIQKDGLNFQWCHKCNRWTTNHGTSGHRGPEQQGSSAAANLAHNGGIVFDDDPSAWFSDIRPSANLAVFDLETEPNVPSRYIQIPPIGLLTLLMITFLLSTALVLKLQPSQIGRTVLPSITMLTQILTGHICASLSVIVASFVDAPLLWTYLLGLTTFGVGSLCTLTRMKDTTNSTKKKPFKSLTPAKRKQHKRFARKIEQRYQPRSARHRRPNAQVHRRRALQRLVPLLTPPMPRPPHRPRSRRPRRRNNRSRFGRPVSREGEGKGQGRKVFAHSPPSNAVCELMRDMRPSGHSKARCDLTGCKQAAPKFTHRHMSANVAQFEDKPPATNRSAPTSVLSASYLPANDTFPVIWDTGASMCVSPHRSDFFGPITASRIANIDGYSDTGSASVAGAGHVVWSFIDVTGQLRSLKLPAVLVPTARHRLLSTNSLLQAYPDETILLRGDGMTLSGAPANGTRHQRNPVEVYIQRSNGLLIGRAYSDFAHLKANSALSASISLVSDANANLSAAAKELLRWHYRLGHIGMRRIQFLLKTGVLGFSEGARRIQASAATVKDVPMCAACQFGKQRRRSAPGTTSSSTVKDTQGALKREDLLPGQRTSVDHFQSSIRGRLPNTFGKESDDDKYCGGAIFVDHASGFVNIQMQSHFNTHETLDSVRNYTQFCRDYGVIPQSFVTDAGTSFTSTEFLRHLHTFVQDIRYAGASAHHHNGIAERNIGTIMSIARTMMIHASTHWPDTSDPQLWPFAVKYAVYIFNHMPNPNTGLSPHDIFSRARWQQKKFLDCHVWGCPVYVLEKTLADGKKLPRWKPRSKRTVFVGVSDRHASTVPLVLDLDTGKVTAQFHVVFDDWFATVTADPQDVPLFDSPTWQSLFTPENLFSIPTEDDADEEGLPDLIAPTDSLTEQKLKESQAAHDLAAPPVPLTRQHVAGPPPMIVPPATPASVVVPVPPTPTVEAPTPARSPQREHITGGSAAPTVEAPAIEQTPTTPIVTPPATAPSTPPTSKSTPKKPATPLPTRRSARIQARKEMESNLAVERLLVAYHDTSHYAADSVDCCYREHPILPICPMSNVAMLDVPIERLCSLPGLEHLEANKARAVKDPDTLTFDEAMRSPDRDKWIAAAQKEIKELADHGTWVEVPLSHAKQKPINGMWTFRRKRSPDGEIKKFKARWCLRGDQMDDTGTDTYAPVASWSSVRLFLTLSIKLKWATVSIDFSNAFVQAHLKEPMWARLPRGFRSSLGTEACLELRRSQYGSRFAPSQWWECLSNVLLNKLGFSQSETDPCLLFRPGLMLVIYVDDLGVAAADMGQIDSLVDELRTHGLTLTKEDSFSEFLGISIRRVSENRVELTQTGLIDKVIKTCGLEDCNPNSMPQALQPLAKDEDGEPMSEKWVYSSVIGMLLYLSTNTRPDIALAVSQVARFSSNPKACHAKAVKTIVRYLSGTRTKGTFFDPTADLKLELYVDADFAALFGIEDPRDPRSSKSRTGYIVFLAGCPLIWKSVLQTDTALSTLEAEYSALSYALKAYLPIRRLLIEVVTALDVVDSPESTISSSVFEDNQGTYLLATNHRLTNRTRYFHVKWHWFWAYANEFVLYKVESRMQRADFFTKALPRDAFEHNRLLVLGW